MRLFYEVGILLYNVLIHLFSVFNAKAKRWVEGRKDWYSHMSNVIDKEQSHIWFHFASLGEFEQGRSVLEAIRKQKNNEKIIITFFSPSGYEIRKNTALADYVFYLPIDTYRNAQRFIQLINPVLVVFTKYEFWFNYFRVCYAKHIPIVVISAIFRSDQLFFKWYGGFYRKILSYVNYFFVQNEESKRLLNAIGLQNVTFAGDTRFDRVVHLPEEVTDNAGIIDFCDHHSVLVAGSTWPEDEHYLKKLIDKEPDWKLIVAPHEIHKAHLEALMLLFGEDAVFYSKLQMLSSEDLRQKRVLIIDNIGMLSTLYHYGKIAYIGGGFGVGIHNTLEAATYGIPVLFGPKYHKFHEAKALISKGAAFSFDSFDELIFIFKSLENPEHQKKAGAEAKNYVMANAGATEMIHSYIQRFIRS